MSYPVFRGRLKGFQETEKCCCRKYFSSKMSREGENKTKTIHHSILQSISPARLFLPRFIREFNSHFTATGLLLCCCLLFSPWVERHAVHGLLHSGGNPCVFQDTVEKKDVTNYINRGRQPKLFFSVNLIILEYIYIQVTFSRLLSGNIYDFLPQC